MDVFTSLFDMIQKLEKRGSGPIYSKNGLSSQKQRSLKKCAWDLVHLSFKTWADKIGDILIDQHNDVENITNNS